MTAVTGYVLGDSQAAARRLDIQDRHFADASEKLLDDLAIAPGDRVVELGCGAGSFSRRVARRLGPRGVLVGVDRTEGLLKQAVEALVAEKATFVPIVADASRPGAWLDGADVVLGRAVLHHVPFAELLIGRLKSRLKSGVRVGFIEPDFRSPLARLAMLVEKHPEFEPLLVWARMLNDLYQANGISPAVGATLARAMELAGYQNTRSEWELCPSDQNALDNMILVYDEIRDRLRELAILAPEEVDRQQSLLKKLTPGYPAIWGTFRVTGAT
jgi:ubiquinone/menaquinone biosynthesis C-methylase UbiE